MNVRVKNGILCCTLAWAVIVWIPFQVNSQELGAAKSSPWFQWGGPSADFTLPDSAERHLLTWPEEGDPHVLWKKELGAGYAAIVTNGDALFVAYRKEDREHMAALNSTMASLFGIAVGRSSFSQTWVAVLVPAPMPHHCSPIPVLSLRASTGN